jgi:hypothetical protein|tara:strand:- start:3450 stop:3812 length:363 start_codon:yes stop_codon:yes gene_type:complete
MKKIFVVFCFSFYFSNAIAQQWIIVDIVSQNSKELVVLIDDGQGEIEREKIKNPSIVSLINDYQEQGFALEKVTQGVELDLNGSLPLNNANRMNNFGFTNLTLSNNNRILLWFKKPKQGE